MFIRRTQTRGANRGKIYFSHRLVRSERRGRGVRQRTLLNLGSDFAVPREHWAVLCTRIEELIEPQGTLSSTSCPPEVERQAQRMAALLVSRGPGVEGGGDEQTVDVDSLELVRPRSVGVEHVGLWAMERVGLSELLDGLGFNRRQRAAAQALIIARMAQPGSERASWQWLCHRSGLGELLGVDFESMSPMRFYRVSDALMGRRSMIEDHLFDRVTELFGLGQTVTLYDLTNTFFEGQAQGQPKARRGHSKEKRSDCPLLTLGLVLDGSGFVRRSEVFAGNVDEDKTLAVMLDTLKARADALVVLDRGVATENNVAWLKDNGYRYLVISRRRPRIFDPELAVAIDTRSHQKVHIQRTVDTHRGEVRLYCYSTTRAQKEEGIARRLQGRFEAALQKLHLGLSKPRARKNPAHVWRRIGRIQEQSRGVSQHYQVEVLSDPQTGNATAVTWQHHPIPGSLLTHPGVYCLRTNVLDWDPQTLWRTYTMLTDLEAVFRSLKSELGLRPIFHQKQSRSDGHLFISVLAYQLVQIVRTRLAAAGDPASWTTLRRILQAQHRITATFRRKDGRTLHVRKATRPEPPQLDIYNVLGLDPSPGGVKKFIA